MFNFQKKSSLSSVLYLNTSHSKLSCMPHNLPTFTVHYCQNQIRLLTLLPGAHGQPSRGRLNPIPLPKNHPPTPTAVKYKALSYMWGTGTFGGSVLTIDEHQLPLKANLNTALRRL